MRKAKAFRYIAESKGNIDEFAKSILYLTNLKSSRGGTVLEVLTMDGTNRIIVVTEQEFDHDIEMVVGEIKDKDEIDVLIVDYDSLDDEGQKLVSNNDNELLPLFIKVEDLNLLKY